MAQDDEPTLGSIIKLAIAKRLVDVHTNIPGRVVAYDKKTQLADVQPAVMGYGNKGAEALPVVHNVPVCFQGAGDFSITFPINVGDDVLLCFTEASIDRWVVSSGGVLDPKDPRRFHISDATCIPGIRTTSTATDQVSDDDLIVAVPTESKILLGDKLAAFSPVKGEIFIPAFKNAIQSVINALALLDPIAAPEAAGAYLEEYLASFELAEDTMSSTKVKVSA